MSRILLRTWLDPVLLLISALVILPTLHPLLWWGDGPELLTAAHTNGVAHPTGYPLYLLALKFFSWIPVGSLAYRGTLFSLVCTLLSIFFLFRLYPLDDENRLTAVLWRLGILVFVFSPLVWEATTQTEVYPFALFLLALTLYCSHRFHLQQTLFNINILMLLSGLMVGHHRLSLLILPGVALYLSPGLKKGNSVRILGTAWIPFLAGVLIPYLFLHHRASLNPPMNWEEASNLENLWRLFSAYQFRIDQKIIRMNAWLAYDRGMGPNPLGMIANNLISIPSTLWKSFGAGVVLAVIGLVPLFFTNRRLLVSGMVAWGLPTLFICQYAVADQSTFHLVPGLLLAPAMGNGLVWIAKWAHGHHPFLIRLVVVIPLVWIGYSWHIFPQADKNLLELPERYARRVLNQIPPCGILVASPKLTHEPVDFTYFPLLYQREVAHRNTAASLFSDSYLISPWYRGTLVTQGLPTEVVDALYTPTDTIEIRETTLDEFIHHHLPEMQRIRQEGKEPMIIFKVGERFFYSGEAVSSYLLAKKMILPLSSRPIYFTALVDSLNPYLPETVRWNKVLEIPMITGGYEPLDGLPIPSGKLYQLEGLAAATTNSP